MEKCNENWFSDWFNTSYYHLLYQDRDESEANFFIENLIHYLNPKLDAKILDLACGKGRHSLIIKELGYIVTGIDLSKNSIDEAKKNENEKLNFAVHDMREAFEPDSFDYVFNLFTSFGYFNDSIDNQKVLDAVAENLTSNGWFVLDFLNSVKVVNGLVPFEEKEIGGVHFKISKTFENNVIRKKIEFTDQGRDYSFTEQVTAFSKKELEQLFKNSQLEIMDCFGNYKLEEFKKENSDRLIIIAKKAF